MFMKYKRISTKDYLVNENQFIELLENKALEGWYLKNISLNFLTFEKNRIENDVKSRALSD